MQLHLLAECNGYPLHFFFIHSIPKPFQNRTIYQLEILKTFTVQPTLLLPAAENMECYL